ncbi:MULTISPECIES: hypothetical protein [Flavobacteriaceae]|uniref:hypothetical protein n=1 Tax=Flavobacteriaceae TaxID=49546 RepID=UPI001490A966|nr:MULTISPECIES: hypothetical protein [Allomuricauda]MDC6367184.1 hypothetical protein [Muricauda sp. AC10]
MKAGYLKISILVISVIVLGNVSSGFINMFQTYLYQTNRAEFEFTTMPTKGRDIEIMEIQFSHFRTAHPQYRDLVLFRTFKRNPLKFWNWYSYLTNEMYQYEYKDEIKSFSGKGKFGI